MGKLLYPNGPGPRFVRIKWKGWRDLGTGDGTADYYWERRADMAENQNYCEIERQFWQKNKHLKRHQNLEIPGTHRCIWCNQLDFASAAIRDAHVEENECGHVPNVAAGSIDDREVKRRKRQKIMEKESQQIKLPGPTPVQQHTLETVTQYNLLGHQVAYDNSCMPDIEHRLSSADQSFFPMYNVWKRKDLDIRRKIRLYRHIHAIAKYGCHTWKLTTDVCAKLNGWNARRECIVLGDFPTKSWQIKTDGDGKSKPITVQPSEADKAVPRQRQQAKDPAVDIVKAVERDQFIWLGKKLRLPKERLIRQHVLNLAYRIQRKGAADGGKNGFMRHVVGQYATPYQLAILAGWEPAGKDLEQWTVVERVTAENNREKWAQKAEQMKPKDLDYRLELEIQEADEEYRKMAQAVAAEQRKNREPTAGEKEQQQKAEAAKAANIQAATIATYHCMRALVQQYPGILVIGTDGGAIPEDDTTNPPTVAKAGWGVTAYKITGAWAEKAVSGIEQVAEIWGPVEMDITSDYFLGARKLTNHTAEISGMCMAFLLLLTVRLHHVAIYYDAETDAAMLKDDTGEPAENQAIISVGRELRRLVEQNGTVLHWVKVKGHSADTINDKADELATTGMHGKDQHGRTRQPRQLKYKQIVSHHYDKAEERRQAEMRETEQDE